MTTQNNNHPIFTWSFWKATIERVLTTFLECYFGVVLFSATPLNPFTFDWFLPLGPAVGAAILTVVKCVLSGLGGNAGPSLANETLTDYPRVGQTS